MHRQSETISCIKKVLFYEAAKDIDAYEAAAAYAGPVLLIHGDADETVPFEYAEKALKLYKNAKLIPIHGDDHCFTRHLNEMADALRAFFKEECK